MGMLYVLLDISSPATVILFKSSSAGLNGWFGLTRLPCKGLICGTWSRESWVICIGSLRGAYLIPHVTPKRRQELLEKVRHKLRQSTKPGGVFVFTGGALLKGGFQMDGGYGFTMFYTSLQYMRALLNIWRVARIYTMYINILHTAVYRYAHSFRAAPR